MAWYEDPATVVAVVVLAVGLSYLVYRLLKEIWDRL